jgi:drug/metabolite transporter (DMT)-like permease
MSDTTARAGPAALPQENILLGSLYICISAAMFAAAGAAVKLALADITPVQLVFWRNLLSMVIFGLFLGVFRPQALSDLKSKKVGLHILRSVLSLFVLYAYFYAVSKIELATAVLFLSTSPVFVPILALLFLGHASARTVWLGVLIAFGGVALIIDPTLRFSFDFNNILGMASGLLSGFLGAAATVVIWKMSDTESPDRQMVYFTVVSFLLSLPLCLYSWKTPQLATFIPITCLGIATTLAQYYLSKGCQVAPADKINTWNYLSIVIAAVAAYIGWNEVLALPTVLGMLFVVGGATLASRRMATRRKV